MPSATEISTSICAALALSEPELDTSIGSVQRKIIDAVAQSIAEAYNDQHVTNYQYDIDSMSGGTLEGFVRLFGIDRNPARYAVGTVTFTRTSALAATGSARIPIGTQVLALTDPVQYVHTTSPAVMAINQTTIDVPVQAMVSGAQGNIGAGLITRLASNAPGLSINTVNADPLSGGQNAETDAVLRARWKSTVFRNLAGTMQMYRAMALASDDLVTAVNVLGPKKTWLDRITISSGASPAVNYGSPQFIYSTGVFLGPDIGSLSLASRGSQYTVTINNPSTPGALASITFNAVSGQLDDGDYDIQYNYVPLYSRNDPFGTRWPNGQYINNRIDIWTNGVRPVLVTQACKFSVSSSLQFNNTSGSDMNRTKYSMLNGQSPALNDYFMPLGYGPIVYVPATLTDGTNTYHLGTDYDVVHQSDAFGYGPNSNFGLMWHSGATLPAPHAAISIQYQYNSVPAIIQQKLQSTWRIMGTDVMAHAGISTQYRFHFGIMYTRGFDLATVQTSIQAAVGALVNNLGFDSSLQVSDVLQAVHNVPGVDNVRFLTSTDDATHYAIEPIDINGNPTTPISQSGGRAKDLYFDDAHYPSYHSCRFVTMTRTTFGTP